MSTQVVFQYPDDPPRLTILQYLNMLVVGLMVDGAVVVGAVVVGPVVDGVSLLLFRPEATKGSHTSNGPVEYIPTKKIAAVTK